MSGDICFDKVGELKWWGSTGVYFWVVRFLAENVTDEQSVATLQLADRENLKWLHVYELAPLGQREILDVLGGGRLTRYAEKFLPDSVERAAVLESLARLAELARQASA